MALMEELRRRVGGMGLPSYVLDTEDKGGKIPLTPDRVLSTDGEVLLKTNDGRVISYEDTIS
jgi:lysine 2,3-aminomutase